MSSQLGLKASILGLKVLPLEGQCGQVLLAVLQLSQLAFPLMVQLE
jgi:hypothetical protein